jgi:hypothetical protein
MLIVYHSDGSKTELNRRLAKSYEIDDRKPFHERVVRSYYELECNGKLPQGYNKNWTKRVWERDAARTEAGLD